MALNIPVPESFEEGPPISVLEPFKLRLIFSCTLCLRELTKTLIS